MGLGIECEPISKFSGQNLEFSGQNLGFSGQIDTLVDIIILVDKVSRLVDKRYFCQENGQ